MTRRALAMAVGCIPSYVTKLERGEREASVARLQRIARALEVSIADLVPALPQDEGPEEAEGGDVEPDDPLIDIVSAADVEDPEHDRVDAVWPVLDVRRRAAVAEFAEYQASRMGAGNFHGERRGASGVVHLGEIFDVVRGAEITARSVLTTAASDKVLRSGERWASCTLPSDLRPGWVAPASSKIAVRPDDRRFKTAHLHEGAGPAVALEPRALIAGVINPRRAVPRSLYVVAPKPGKQFEVEPQRVCERLSVLACADAWPKTMTFAKFFSKSRVPPVSVIEKAPWPRELERNTDRSRQIDSAYERLSRWSRGLRATPGLSAFDQQLTWREMSPERERINQVINSMMRE